MSMSYLTAHVRSALQNYRDIDTSRLNGEGSDPDVQAILQSLSDAHKRAGQEGVKTAWRQIATHYPNFAAQVDAPSRLLSFEELCELPPPTYLYPADPLHVPILSNATHVLWGAPGIGKSFIALAWAMKIAQSHDVVYVMAEGVSGYPKRAKAIQQETGASTQRMLFWNGKMTPTDPDIRDQFIESIKARGRKPALIVLDTLTRTIAGDENQADVIRAYFDACDVIREAFEGCSILIIHHSNKDGTDFRGSISIEGNPDVVYHLDDVDGFVKVSADKVKDSQRFIPWHFILKPVQVGKETTLVVHLVQDTKTWRGITPRQREILDALSLSIFSQGQSRGATRTDLKDMLGIPTKDLMTTLSRMLDAHLIDRDGKGHYYPTAKGWKIIRGEDAPTEQVEPVAPAGNVEF